MIYVALPLAVILSVMTWRTFSNLIHHASQSMEFWK